MFMTFRCGSQEDANEMQNVRVTDRTGRPNNTSRVACVSCRKKKARFPFLTFTTLPRQSRMSSVPTAWHAMCIRCPHESRR
ncbi:hypothetical protein C7974DRAFT_435389 [Boeremia exigua]|uniref:uncharacterized protein n=1 Tax=Boeremia exigua TaxID=749465 RepID=UPI001E8EAE1F|nr:uncharacterized protein C7974DRAFT_435389 [Boeremia exigua]KAH6622422.1 hypothetical protein C7974DRAFT_435389 [Boeremia exigua]